MATADLTYRAHFDSVQAAVENAQRVFPNVGWDTDRRYTNKEWIGRTFDSWSQLFEAANQPWPAGRDTMEGLHAQLVGKLPTVKIASTTRRRRPSEYTGASVDCDKLRRGDPDYWVELYREPAPRAGRSARVVRVLIDQATSGDIQPDAMLWRGAVGVVLADILERAGYRVQIDTISCTLRSSDFWKQVSTVTVKAAGTPVNIEALASAVSGWYYRTVGFLNQPGPGGEPTLGLGRPLQPSEWPEGTYSEHDIVIFNLWSLDAAKAKVQSVLSALGAK